MSMRIFSSVQLYLIPDCVYNLTAVAPFKSTFLCFYSSNILLFVRTTHYHFAVILLSHLSEYFAKPCWFPLYNVSLKNKQVLSLTSCGWNLCVSSDCLSSEVPELLLPPLLPFLIPTWYSHNCYKSFHKSIPSYKPWIAFLVSSILASKYFQFYLSYSFWFFIFFFQSYIQLYWHFQTDSILALIMQSHILPPATNFHSLLPEHITTIQIVILHTSFGDFFFPRKVGFEYSWIKQGLLHTASYTACATGSH